MERDVRIRPTAARDLERLYDYIRDQRDPHTALKYVRRVRGFCGSLGLFSERGTRRDDLCPGLRLVAFERRVVIAFFVDERSVRITRLFYGGRDVDALLGETPPSFD